MGGILEGITTQGFLLIPTWWWRQKEMVTGYFWWRHPKL
jgi:hypothetical protein